MSKLDEHGLLTQEYLLSLLLDSGLPDSIRFGRFIREVVTAERDALLELFETWIEEDYSISVDRHSLPTHLFQRIAKLQSGPQTKDPSG